MKLLSKSRSFHSKACRSGGDFVAMTNLSKYDERYTQSLGLSNYVFQCKIKFHKKNLKKSRLNLRIELEC